MSKSDGVNDVSVGCGCPLCRASAVAHAAQQIEDQFAGLTSPFSAAYACMTGAALEAVRQGIPLEALLDLCRSSFEVATQAKEAAASAPGSRAVH